MLPEIKKPDSFFTATSERLLREFYIPALGESVLYQRGVAYFSISFFINLLDTVVDFIERGGIIYLVTSVQLDSETVESFASGYILTERDVEAQLANSIDQYKAAAVSSQVDDSLKLDVIANMIASRRLIIKVAYVSSGLYHEKIGLFTDAEGNTISFIGSANATVNAYKNNFETINFFSSWEEPGFVSKHQAHFSKLWNDEITGIRVIPFPQAIEERILSDYKISHSLEEALRKLRASKNSTDGSTVMREIPELRDYQSEAIDQFAAYGFSHFYEMATGTGKTFTAVKSIERMLDIYSTLNVIILVPLKDLQVQWRQAIEKSFSDDYILSMFGGIGRSDVTDYNLSAAAGAINKKRFAAIAICVYDTFFSRIVSELSPVAGEVLIIVDEAHNLTPGNLYKLRKISKYRLGLSATPERHNPQETSDILSYFLQQKQPSFKFGLEEAIIRGYLSPYEYYPIPVSLTDDEAEIYNRFSQQICIAQSAYNSNPTPEKFKVVEELKMKRSLVVKKAVNKLSVLTSLVNSPLYSFSNSVVFCGPGAVEFGDASEPQKILDIVTRIISNSTVKRYYPAKYTSSEDDERPARLEDFKQGYTDTLVAIKCFDEGIDVPALDKIYIMSSDTSKRQTIQRRGRVLRISKNTGKEKAAIYDFVAGVGGDYCFKPLPAECPRVYEYARLSLNPQDSAEILEDFDTDDDDSLFDVQ